MTRRATVRTILGLVAPLLVVLTLACLFGPREPVGATVSALSLPRDLVAELAADEAGVPALRPEAAKEIIFAYPASRAKTRLAIVYVHGFSASKSELRPVPDDVASALDANLFFTRLAGHGRDGAAMAEPTVQDWLDDYAEAIAIGRRLGERVIVIATSTGAALATYASALGDDRLQVDGLVLISPNYRLADWKAFALTLPFARAIVPFFMAEHSFTPLNPAHAAGWTTRYPSAALLPMAALTQAARESEVSRIREPTLFIASPADKIVDPAATRAVAARWGGPHETMLVEGSADPSSHLLAGDAVSPGTTPQLVAAIVAWAQRTGLAAPTIRSADQ